MSSIYGAPLAYTTTSEVLLIRPDKFRVITAHYTVVPTP
jgi:hypothetical protein